MTKTGAGILTVDGPQDHAPGSLFDILDGSVWLNTDAGIGLSINVTDATLYFGFDQHLDTLAIGDGGAAVFAVRGSWC